MKNREFDISEFEEVAPELKERFLRSSSPDVSYLQNDISPNFKHGKYKIGDGNFLVDGERFLSIWSLKNEFNLSDNDSSSNYEDAGELFRNRFVTQTITVYTHSPHFPKVKGYLLRDLDKYFDVL